MAEQAALHGRNAAATVLAESLRELKRYREKGTYSQRILQMKLNKVSAAKDDVMTKHCYYGEKANKPLDSQEMVDWLTEKMDSAIDEIDEAELILEDIENKQEKEVSTRQKTADDAAAKEKKAAELKIAELQAENDKKTVQDNIKKLSELIEDEAKTEKEDANLAEIMLKEVESAYEEQIKSWNIYKTLVEDENQLKQLFEEETQIKNKLVETRTQANAFIRKIKPESVPETKTTSSSSQDQSNSMKVEKMKNPSYHGDARSYARFKKNFKEIVVPNYPNEKQLIYVLKDNCLKGEAKKLVENIVDIKDIWERLDEKYGKDIDIVNLVVKDIQNLTIPKQDQESGFVNLVDTLEKGLQDLGAIEARNEIANAYTVKLIEEKLPYRIKSKWFEKESSEEAKTSEETEDTEASKKNKFESLFVFLKQERKMTERMIQSREKKNPKDDKKPPHLANAAIGNDGQPKKANNKCLIHPNSTHLTRKCHAFRSKTVVERGQLVKDMNACKFCLSLSHPGVPCPFLSQWGPCGINGCTDHHSRMVHGCGIQGISMQVFKYNNRNSTLLLVQTVETTYGDALGFFDNGSTITLIARSFAERHNLKGVNITYELITVDNNVQVHHTVLYEITLLDKDGNAHVIQAYQIESICKIPRVQIDDVASSFPSIKHTEIIIESGDIDLMIGMDHGELHPSKVDSNNGLILYESQFGSGYVIAGTHRKGHDISAFNQVARYHSHAQLANVRVAHCMHCSNPGVDFFTAEGFGVSIPPRCPSCANCKRCSFETHQLSRQDRDTVTKVRHNLVLDPIAKKWTTTYPLKCDPQILVENRDQALKYLDRTENRLKRNATNSRNYCEQFRDFIERNVITEVTDEEREAYSGPQHYVTHHEVLKPESTSTPVRLVINSSLKYKGLSFNDILLKGPNALRDLYGIQLNFRTHLHALVCDIRKMYHSVLTTKTEKFLRLMVWRDMQLDQPPKTYGFETVTFGDKPAAIITACAIQETAKTYTHIDPEAARIIEEDLYADDIVTGAETTEEINKLKKSIPEILSKGGFHIKGAVTSGDTSPEALALLGSGDINRVLGMNWNPATDKLTVSTRINISKKRRGVRTEPDLTYEQIPRILEVKLTKRMVLVIVMACYDPLGLLCIITIQIKIELRKLYKKELNLGWDDPLTFEQKQRWVELLLLLKRAETVEFKRCIKPPTAVGEPDLILFNDASVDAMCVMVYVRWKLQSGEYECVLWTAKTRVTPLRKGTVPRFEMISAVMGARARKVLGKHCKWKFKRVIHILDSMCTLALLHNDTSALGEFMGNKVTEALEIAQPEEFFHTPSKENIADLGTRCNATIEDLAEDGPYQRGPAWLRLEMKDWPVTQDYSGTDIPEEELVKISAHVSTSAVVTPVIDVKDFKEDSYKFLLKVAAIVLKIIQTKRFEIDPLSPADLDLAERHCLKMSMELTKEDMKAGKLASIRPVIDEDGIIVLSSRAKEGLKLHYNQDRFPILAYKDPLAFLWIKHVHEEDHSGVTRTVAKSRRKYWIVRARRLALKIRLSCRRCRLLDKKLAMQQMAPLPEERLAMTPVFYITSMDLFGPVLIKDSVKQRTEKKVWGVIFTCDSTRAVYLDLTEGYSTDDILETIRKFTCNRGCPSEFRSDQGSQLISASKDITQLVEDWDWSVVQNWSTSEKIKWTVVPAEGQHQNGLSESLIKSVKRSIMHKIGKSVLTFSGLQLCMYEIANIINSRPIGIVTGSDPEQPQPITPNDLLLGRSSLEPPQGPFDNCRSVNKRFRFRQNLVKEWWEHWYASVLPSLVPSYKWLQRHRNVMVGDVCLIRYGKDKRATYRLGRVTEVVKGDDNLVRKVKLKYKLPTENTFRTVDRPIHGIAVIVPVEEQEDAKEENQDVSSLNPQAEPYVPTQQ